MEIVIFAAGMGKRFGANIPKCMIDIYGKTILQRQIETIRCVFSGHIHVVIGYQSDMVIQEIRRLKQYKPVSYIRNPFFQVAGIMGSAAMLMPHLSSPDILRLDGDVLIDDPVQLCRLFDAQESVFGVSPSYRKGQPLVTTSGPFLTSIVIEDGDGDDGRQEWMCIEMYRNYQYQQLISSCPNVVTSSYFAAVNNFNQIRRGQRYWYPFKVVKLSDIYEIDTLQDLIHVERSIKSI